MKTIPQALAAGVAAALALAAAITFAAPPGGRRLETDVPNQWGARHWPTATIRVNDYGAMRAADPTHWRAVRDAALSAWEAAGVRFVVNEREGPLCVGRTPRSIGRARRAFPAGRLSICRWRADGAAVLAGWTTAPPNSAGVIQRAVVAVRSPNSLCHEVGHALGLDHPTDAEDAAESCMGAGDWRYPSPFDLQSISTIYGSLI